MLAVAEQHSKAYRMKWLGSLILSSLKGLAEVAGDGLALRVGCACC